MYRRMWLLALGALVGSVGCADGPPPSAPPDEQAWIIPNTDPGALRLERLARGVALALKDPALRDYVKSRLEASPYPEHKVHLGRLLGESGGRGLRALASASGQSEASITSDVQAARAVEVYLPVPEHRRSWTGDERVLVATALRDGDMPVAFDLTGRRHLLDPKRPPKTPVLAVVPAEIDFDRPIALATAVCPLATAECGAGGLTSTPPSGLYMSYSHFVQTFEGWLKGSPEFEIHILGQLGTSDSLTTYACAGEHASGSYAFDQNGLDWSGSVLLLSQAAINAYKSAHPGQSIRILALEDDDTACQIKIDQNRFKTLVTSISPVYKDITGARDTLTWTRVLKAAKSLQNLLSAIASWIKTNDDLIGNAIEDVVVGEYHPGANWVVKGDNNVTNGWLKLEIR